MGQLTLARFRGDTTFGLVARIISTFGGGLTGAAVWHISTGAGRGSPYGLAAVCAVAFPFFFYVRLYLPGPPVPNMIFFTTTALVCILTTLVVHPNLMITPRHFLGDWILVAECTFYWWRLFVLRNKPCLGMCSWFMLCLSNHTRNFRSGGLSSFVRGCPRRCEPQSSS